jgi:hypothetical protein
MLGNFYKNLRLVSCFNFVGLLHGIISDCMHIGLLWEMVIVMWGGFCNWLINLRISKEFICDCNFLLLNVGFAYWNVGGLGLKAWVSNDHGSPTMKNVSFNRLDLFW